ncbi:hypothetical protein LXL04_020566 [Taraxacum kok-saghyz]
MVRMNQSEIDEALRDAHEHGYTEIVRSPDSGGCAALELLDDESEGFRAPEDDGYAPTELHGDDNEGQNTQDQYYVKRQETWTPLVDVKPYKGQMFPSFEDAFGFYKEYARKSGFEIRKATTVV